MSARGDPAAQQQQHQGQQQQQQHALRTGDELNRSDSEEFVASYSMDSNAQSQQRLPPQAEEEQQQRLKEAAEAVAAAAAAATAAAAESTPVSGRGLSPSLQSDDGSKRRIRSHSGYGKGIAKPDADVGSSDALSSEGSALIPSPFRTGSESPTSGRNSRAGAGEEDQPKKSKKSRDLPWSFSAVNPNSRFFQLDNHVGVTSEQGHRKTMEDQHSMLIADLGCAKKGDGDGDDDDSAKGSGSSFRVPFFAVYDGHAGTQAAEYLRDNLHKMILSQPNLRENPEAAVINGCAQAETEFMAKCKAERIEAGSTVALALVVDNKLVVGNIGDSEIVLSRAGHAVLLTTKHHLASNPSEVERVKAAGGRIHGNRVGHPKFNPSLMNIAVCRAIGDAGFKLDEYTDGKNSGLIATAETTGVVLTPEDEFLIIGCDGLWDVMTYQDAVHLCREALVKDMDNQKVTEMLVQVALDRMSSDNITVMFVNLRERGAPPLNKAPVAPLIVATKNGLPVTVVAEKSFNALSEELPAAATSSLVPVGDGKAFLDREAFRPYVQPQQQPPPQPQAQPQQQSAEKPVADAEKKAEEAAVPKKRNWDDWDHDGSQ